MTRPTFSACCRTSPRAMNRGEACGHWLLALPGTASSNHLRLELDRAVDQLPLSASAGGTRAARLAGRYVAPAAAIRRIAAASAYVAGSTGVTPNRRERTRRDAPAAPARPTNTPRPAVIIP